ncbi:peptide transporter PTR2-like, partial [Trifolium medium]|nr:peptide transporter PTR2-like [Trifolium medium]
MLVGALDMEFLHCLLVISAAIFRRKLEVPQDNHLLFEIGSSRLQHSDGLRFLDKAAVISDADKETAEATSPWRLCTVTQVEELKI